MVLEPRQLLQIGLLAAVAAAAVYAMPYGARAGGEMLPVNAAGKTALLTQSTATTGERCRPYVALR